MADNRPMSPMHPLRPWIMWATGAAFFYFAFFQRTAPSVMVPDLMRDFGVTAAALGNLSAYYFWTYTAMQIPTGIMADRWGPRRLLACTAAVSGIGASLILLGWGTCAPFVGWLSDRLRRRKLPLVIAAGLNALCMAALFYTPDLSRFAIHAILLANGVATAGMAGCFVMAREHNATEDAGAAMAFVNMAIIGCGAFFQPVSGWLLDRGWTGEMAAGVRVYSEAAFLGAFWILPASCAVATVLALLTKEIHARPQVD